MSKKLRLNPDVAYFLGLYAYSKGKAIQIVTNNQTVIERFAKTAITEFDIDTNKILFEDTDSGLHAYFYNTKLKKLLDKALDRKDITFKYKNDYSASYIAGIFDIKGGSDSRGYFIRDLSDSDMLLIERLGFHTKKMGGFKTYFTHPNIFVSFIKNCSGRFVTK